MAKTIGIDEDILAGDDVRFLIETHDGTGCLVVPYQVESVTVYFITREFTESNATEYTKEFFNEDIQREYERVKQSVCIKAKQTVHVASTSNLALSGLSDVDGVGLSVGDRVLVKDQTDPSQNGIYVASDGAWSRSSDMLSGSKVVSGTYVFVENGISAAASGWVYSKDGTVVVGTNNLPFVLFAQNWMPESPDDEQRENLRVLGSLKAQLDASKSTSAFFYKDALVVKKFGGEKDSTGEFFPAWLNPDGVPTGDRAKVSADNILVQMEDDDGVVAGKFLLDWSTSGMREGDYFVCWSWRPNMGSEVLSAHNFFHLGGDSSVTSSIPTHRIRSDKYEILLERYTPEMFKTRISDSDLAPEVMSEFNKAVASGFMFLENQAAAVIDLLDANAVHEQLLPLLSNMFNLKVKSNDPTLWRRQIKKAVGNFKKKGSIEGLREVLKDSGMSLLRFARLWQVVPKYTWQEHFVHSGKNEFELARTPVLPLDDSFRLWVRYKDKNSWVEISGSGSSSSSSGHWAERFVSFDGKTMTWLDAPLGPGLRALSKDDSIRILYKFRAIPAGEREKESYIRDLPLMDSRDERLQKYPPKNWNVHLVEEDDENFNVLVPVRHPFSDPVVWGRVRTEFPYSENLYNMEEYNGSTRESLNPCDIDKEFLDSCGQCLSSKFNMDIEVEMLSDESLKEMRQIVQEYMPFHAVPNSFNLWGSVNEFVRQSEERIQALVQYSHEDVLLSGEAQRIFNRSVYRSDLPSVRRDILASFENQQSPSSGSATWSGVLKNTRTVLLPSSTGSPEEIEDLDLESASFGFDAMNVNTGNMSSDPFESDNLLEIMGSTIHNYSISHIESSLAEVYGTVEPTLIGSLFEYRISNRIGDFNVDIAQYEEIIFDDSDTDFSMLGIVSQHDIEMGLASGSAWSLVYGSVRYSIQNILPDGTLLLEYESASAPISGWELKKGSVSIKSRPGGSKKTRKYGLVEIKSPSVTDVKEILRIGDFVYMGWPSSRGPYMVKSFQKDTNNFYIQDYDAGDVGGQDVKIYRRVMKKKIGQFGHDSPVIVTVDNIETALGLSEEDSSKIKENYILFVDDEYYTISGVDGNTVRISGPQIFNDTTGTSVSFSVLKFSKKNLTLTEKQVPPYDEKPPEYTFDSVDRSGGAVIAGSEGSNGLSGLSSVLNSTKQMDVVSHDEDIQYSVEYKEKETK